MMIDIEGIPAEAYNTTLPLNQFVPVGEHYAICSNCGLLHFRKGELYEGEEIMLDYEPPTCNHCANVEILISRIAQQN